MENEKKQVDKNFLPLGAALSGLLCYIAFTFTNVAFLIFFAFIPFLFLLFRYTHHNILTKTSVFIFSMCYHVPTLLWLYTLCPIPNTSLSMFVSVLIMTAGIFAAAAVESLVMVLVFLPYNKLRHTKIPLPVIFAFLYIFGEFLQERIGDLAFPWVRLGTALSSYTPLIQTASLFGTIFLSLIILLINGFLALALVRISRHRPAKKTLILLLLAVLLFASNLSYGYIRLAVEEPAIEEDTTVAIVQGNFGSTSKWDTPAAEVYNEHIKLTEQAIKKASPKIVLWSETAIAGYLDEPLSKQARLFAQQNNITLVTGIFDIDQNNKYIYNSMVAFTKNGTHTQPYYKQKLVPAGEYIPYYQYYEKLFPSSGQFIVPSNGGASTLKTDEANIGGIICYESVFPYIVRSTVNSGAQILAMASNDSWFGSTPALEQHLSHAKMRAVENGRFLIRAGNTGISAVISPFGETEQRLPINEEGYLTADIALLNGKTLYTVIGDVVVLPSVLLIIYGIFLMITKHTKKQKKLKKHHEHSHITYTR